MQYVWHQRLEPHVLHTRNQLGRLEVFVGAVTSSFSEVIYEVPKSTSSVKMIATEWNRNILGNFTQRTTFFTEVYDYTNTTYYFREYMRLKQAGDK